MDAETLYLLAKSQVGAVAILSSSGAPSSGTWFTGNLALDSLGVLYICEAGGTPGTWAQATSPWLKPTSKSTNYTAVNGDYVEATASLTVTSPSATSGNRFGALANYAATNASPVTITATSGYLIGPGIPASTSSILLGAPDANISFVCDGTNWLQASGAQDSGWITPTLGNSWGGQFLYRRIANRVEIVIDTVTLGTSGGAAFTLPTGYRLSASQAGFWIESFSTGNAYVTVGSVGTVVPVYDTPGSLLTGEFSFLVG